MGGQRPRDRVTNAVALAMKPLEQSLLSLVAGALPFGEVHGPLEFPWLLVPVRPCAARAWLSGRVLLPGQPRNVAPHSIADSLGLLLRPLSLLGQLEGSSQVPPALVVLDLGHATTLDHGIHPSAGSTRARTVPSDAALRPGAPGAPLSARASAPPRFRRCTGRTSPTEPTTNHYQHSPIRYRSRASQSMRDRAMTAREWPK